MPSTWTGQFSWFQGTQEELAGVGGQGLLQRRNIGQQGLLCQPWIYRCAFNPLPSQGTVSPARRRSEPLP